MSDQMYSYTVRLSVPSDLPLLPAIEKSAAELFRSIPGLESLADDEPMSVDSHRGVIESWKRWRVGSLDDGSEGGTWVVVASFDKTTAETGIERRTEKDNDNSVEYGVVGFIVTELLPVRRKRKTAPTSMSALNGNQLENDDSEIDGFYLHIDELSISALHQTRGLAGKLINAVLHWTKKNSRADFKIHGLSLTTFRDVPFNALLYERKFGFRTLKDSDGSDNSEDEVAGLIGNEGLRILKEDRERLGGLGARCFMVLNL